MVTLITAVGVWAEDSRFAGEVRAVAGMLRREAADAAWVVPRLECVVGATLLMILLLVEVARVPHIGSRMNWF